MKSKNPKFDAVKRNEGNEQEQPNNPLHGVKLKEVLEFLVSYYGWEGLGERIKINCFLSNPTMNSSLKFLRQTPWARDKVERLYLKSIPKFDR